LTAINALARGSRAFLLTDTAAYGFDGVVTQFLAKVVTFPHIRCAFAARGCLKAIQTMAEELAPAQSFDDLIATSARPLREAHEAGSFDWGEEAEPEFELVVVGMSEARRRAEAYIITSVERGEAKPFVFRRHDIITAPSVAPEAMRAGGLFRGGDPAEDLLALAEVQRAAAHPIATVRPDDRHFVVGGSAVLTEISEAGISQRVLRVWPDRVGERIQPQPVPAVSDTRGSPLPLQPRSTAGLRRVGPFG
jgi:hypothetical protein